MALPQFDLITKEAIPHNAQLAGFMHETHEIAGWTIIVAISLHIAGAIKHHFIKND
jgi:cytochrome b561